MEEEKLDKAINLRVSTRLYEDIQRLARKERRKAADWVRVVIEERVAVEGQGDGSRSRRRGEQSLGSDDTDA